VQSYSITIPRRVKPGGQFTVRVGTPAQVVLVTCPATARPGDSMSIQLPTKQLSPAEQQQHPHKVTYQSGSGWIRTIRVTDQKFQWVRITAESVVDDMEAAATNLQTVWKSARVRHVQPLEGNDPRLRTAQVTLIPAEQAFVDSRLTTPNGTVLFTYADIVALQSVETSSDTSLLAKKHEWFLSICRQLTESVSKAEMDNETLDGNSNVPNTSSKELSVKLLVRRDYLLADSVRAVLALSADDMRRPWQVQFVDEPGFDRGGLTREWFDLVTEQVLSPNCGLFVVSVHNQAAVDINPSVAQLCPDDYLQSYRFVGRVLGRGLFTGHLIRGHLVRLLYKHLLGWPTTHEDVQDLDADWHAGLVKLTHLSDVSCASLDFTVTEDCLGVKMERELIAQGASLTVDNTNVHEYLEQCIRYRTFTRILPQLTELLLGFYDVVPEPALSVFDPSELELVLCGLPTIDLDDWQRNTIYSGLLSPADGLASSRVVQWFWDVVEHDFDDEMRARLLQFVTGTSGVSLDGFAHLQSSQGHVNPFTIRGVDINSCYYPKSHTCFNQLDLPMYPSRELLLERLTVSITTSFVGFDTE
jgi:HECT-domain (ubiquitin-transferase)